MFVYCGAYAVYIYGSIRASRSIHNKLSDSVLGATLRWLDMTPVGRVISRFTMDIRAVDGPIASYLSDFRMYCGFTFSRQLLTVL
jgi:ABC-type multidrug transport system fused ATPase/permease subunit